MDTNFSSYCLYQEIGRVAVGMGIPTGIPIGMVWCGYGDWNPISTATADLEISAPNKKTTLRTPVAKSSLRHC